MSASVPPPSSRVQDNDSLFVRVGALVGLATVAALACTLPAMTRVSTALAGDAPLVRAWAALGAATLVPMALSVVALRGARQGLRVFGKTGNYLRAFGLGLWLAALFVTLVLFGGFLRATTHHHALAGVTYACGALAFAVGWGLVCARLVAMLRSVAGETRCLSMILLGSVAVAAIGILSIRFMHALVDGESSSAAATVIDVLAFAFAALLASLDWRVAWRLLAIVGPPAAVFLGALGITLLRDPPVRHAIGEHAPAFTPAADLFSRQ
ncbi:MAG: hypothetical protein M3O46_14265 [Myxococcota bacterium]|nr:hypothetical protein [Myxococcota bacterium]